MELHPMFCETNPNSAMSPQSCDLPLNTGDPRGAIARGQVGAPATRDNASWRACHCSFVMRAEPRQPQGDSLPTFGHAPEIVVLQFALPWASALAKPPTAGVA